MVLRKTLGLSLVLTSLSLGAISAHASVSAKSVFDGVYPGNTISCFVCHTGSPGSLTLYGVQYVNAGGINSGTASAINAIDNLDADNDGNTNGSEIAAGTDPSGNTNTANTETASVYGCMTTSLATPLMIFLALFALGFLLRKKT